MCSKFNGRPTACANRLPACSKLVPPRACTIFPVRKLCCASLASSGSTPTIFADDPLSLMRAGDPADQSAATHRNQHQVDVRAVFQNLQSGRSLAGDDELIVVGRHDGVAVLLGQFFGLLHALGARRTDEHDLRSQRGRAVDLDLRSIARHHDDGLHAHGPRRVRHSLRMVAAGIRDDAASSLLVGKRCDLVVGAPQLERADGLQALSLEEKLRRGRSRRSRTLFVCGREVANQGRSRCNSAQVAPARALICSSVTILDFEDDRHDQRPARRVLHDEAFQVLADLFLDHSVVAALFVARTPPACSSRPAAPGRGNHRPLNWPRSRASRSPATSPLCRSAC